MLRAEKILEINSQSSFTTTTCKDNEIYCDDVSISWNGPGKYAITTSYEPCGRGCCTKLVAFATHIDKYRQELAEYISDLEKELSILQQWNPVKEE